MNGRTGSFFGTVLGRVTMYRLVTLSLGTLAIYAFVLSLFGQVFYKPLELLATLATLLVVGYLTNRLFGALFQVQPHSESSVITSSCCSSSCGRRASPPRWPGSPSPPRSPRRRSTCSRSGADTSSTRRPSPHS